MAKARVRLRHELRIAGVQAQEVIREVPGALDPLGRRVDAPYPLKQCTDGLGAASDPRGIQHELWQGFQDVSEKRAFLVNDQVVGRPRQQRRGRDQSRPRFSVG